MTSKEASVRQWIGRAKTIHDRLYPYEQALKGLNEACGTDYIRRECELLRSQEAVARMELYELLSHTELSPRQFTIINLHYLQYESWTCIANRLNIERRYALQVHIQAIERLASQLKIPLGNKPLTA